jgi:hypothetical protein
MATEVIIQTRALWRSKGDTVVNLSGQYVKTRAALEQPESMAPFS